MKILREALGLSRKFCDKQIRISYAPAGDGQEQERKKVCLHTFQTVVLKVWKRSFLYRYWMKTAPAFLARAVLLRGEDGSPSEAGCVYSPSPYE